MSANQSARSRLALTALGQHERGPRNGVDGVALGHWAESVRLCPAGHASGI